MKSTQTSTSSEESESLNTQSGSFVLYLFWLLLWIVWLPVGFVPPLLRLLQGSSTLAHIGVTLCGGLLFLSVYLWVTWKNAQYIAALKSPAPSTKVVMWLPIVVLTLLSIVMILNDGIDWQGLFIFTCVYAGGRLPTGQAVWTVIVLTLLTALMVRFIDPHWLDLGQPMFLDVVASIIVIGMVRLARTSQELRAAREEIADLAVMAERLRIARDLHDLLGHNLSLIALKSELAVRLITVAPERVVVEMNDVGKVARTMLQEVREAVSNYRRATLAGELRGVQEMLSAAGIAYKCHGDEVIGDTLSAAVESVLSWTIREGVTNIIRHSGARQCTVRIKRGRHEISVEVFDDGIGSFPLPSSNSSELILTENTQGNGLRGLAERVEALDGCFNAGPRIEGGFLLAVSVPLIQRNERPAI